MYVGRTRILDCICLVVRLVRDVWEAEPWHGVVSEEGSERNSAEESEFSDSCNLKPIKYWAQFFNVQQRLQYFTILKGGGQPKMFANMQKIFSRKKTHTQKQVQTQRLEDHSQKIIFVRYYLRQLRIFRRYISSWFLRFLFLLPISFNRFFPILATVRLFLLIRNNIKGEVSILKMHSPTKFVCFALNLIFFQETVKI